jgi:hypothetical protein
VGIPGGDVIASAGESMVAGRISDKVAAAVTSTVWVDSEAAGKGAVGASALNVLVLAFQEAQVVLAKVTDDYVVVLCAKSSAPPGAVKAKACELARILGPMLGTLGAHT